MTKRCIDPIQSERIRLRMLDAADLPTTLAWRNQDHVRRWFFDDRVLAPTDHRAWFERYQQQDNDFVFIVESKAAGRAVGQVSLYRIDWQRSEGEYGRLIFTDADRAQGLATEATIALLRTAFSQWELCRIVAEVYAHNGPSLRLFERCGFALDSRDDRVCRVHVTPTTLARWPLALDRDSALQRGVT